MIHKTFSRSNISKGFSLVELMISIALGLLVVGATLSIFSTNKQAYRTTENLGRVQEGARIGFELIGNDVRESGGTQCSRGIDVVSILTPSAPMASGDFWSDWNNTVRGIDNTGPNGSDTLQLKSGSADMFHVNGHDSTAATIDINSTQNHNLVAGDIAIICDYREGAIFQVTNVAGDAISHSAGGLNTISNLGINGANYNFADHATLSRVNATEWFVAANGRGGNSLFRNTLRNASMGAPEEIAEGVNNMQITYLLDDGADYVTSAFVVPLARWDDVIAVRIAIVFESQDAIGTGGARLQRPAIQTFNLRNRTP